MDTPSTILIVDDDRDIRTLLADYLESNGYRTLAAADGNAMWKALEETRPDLIMLTARNEPLDRILGLEMGADDYLPKPFEPRELLARIRSVLRRSHAMPSNTPSENVQQMRFSGWTLDLTARHLLNPDGIVIMLSGAEFRLLRVFLEHPNRVLNRDQLLNLTQGRDADPFDRSIDIQISRLRQKLGEDARMPQIIKTVRNGGYVLAGQVTVEPAA
jgi:two-component system, OmpR family, response regulator